MGKHVLIFFVVLWLGGMNSPLLASDCYTAYMDATVYAGLHTWDAAAARLKDAIADAPVPGTCPRPSGELFTAYTPYLELGKAHLRMHDAYRAAYYCTAAGAHGVAPSDEVALCLKGAQSYFTLLRNLKGSTQVTHDFPLFPWPPPKASATAHVPRHLLITPEEEGHITQGEIASRLEQVLDKTGYAEKSYYYIPKGFALVTRLEQCEADGTPKKPDSERWGLQLQPPSVFSLASYIKALFTAQEGHFRVIVFLVTSIPVGQGIQEIDRDEAIAWFHQGANVLPLEMKRSPYSADHYCVAYIYEFEQVTRNHEPQFKDPSEILGRVHLKNAGVLTWLEKFSANLWQSQNVGRN